MNKSKTIIRIIGIAAFALLYSAIYIAFLNSDSINVFESTENSIPLTSEYMNCELHLVNFINKHFIKEDGGIITNLNASKRKAEVLSESVGLLMNYAVIKKDKEMFLLQLNYIKKNSYGKDSLIKWKISEDSITCNAAIDDLRIARGMLEAYSLWGDKECFDNAGFIQQGLYRRLVREGSLCEFFDWSNGAVKKSVPLCYLDVYAMDKLSLFNEGWGEVVDKGIGILKNGRISESPLFYKHFDYDTGGYSLDEEYSKVKGICMIYSLYTAIHLAEMNEDTEFFAEWLREENEKGILYGWYDPYTLEPVKSKRECTAVYALAAIYADKVGDKSLRNELVDKMGSFIVKNKRSPYYGGYGDETFKSFYSFDNLTALWALALVNED